MPLYDEFERSDFLGRDVRLYTFTRGDLTYYFASADRDIVYDGKRYAAIAIQDSGLRQKGEAVTDDFTITVPLWHPIVVAFRGTPPSQLVRVTMRQVQYGDTEAPLMWSGYVSSVKFRDAASSDIICNSLVGFLNRRGLRLNYSRACPHVLYDEQCRLNKDDWVEEATLRDVTGNSFAFDLTVANPTGYAGRFTNGFLQWSPETGVIETRTIQTHNDDTCVVLKNTDGLADGFVVALYPGCQRVPSNCQLFGNIANYGGFPMMPGKSPFDGDPVF